MSNRHSANNTWDDGNKGFPKAQKKFVPKTQNWTPKDHPNPTPTLSASLRQLPSSHHDASEPSSGGGGSGASSAMAAPGKVPVGTNGDGAPSRARGGKFVNYLPQDEAVAAGLGADEGGLDPVQSQRVVDLLNMELSRLLKLNPREFWREVASDTSLHEFLDSFLQFRNRWYDFPYHGPKGIVAGIIVGEAELSCRVFMLLYRLSSNKDPGARASDSLSSKDHGVLLQEKKLLDLPKLLDICAIYGHENEELTRLLVENAMNAQPRMHDNLTAMMHHFLSILNTMNDRCSSSLEVLFSTGSHEELQSSRPNADYLEVMDFINDAIVSMDALVTAYKPASVYFSCPLEMSHGNEEMIITLVRVHDTLLPSLQRGFRIIYAGKEDEVISKIAISLKMLSMRIAKFGWKLLDSCYLSDEVFEDNLPIPDATKMFPAKVDDPFIRGDILVQTFREINGVSLHSLENQNRRTFLQNVDKSFNLMSKLESLQNAGWIYMEDEQFQYLSGIMTSLDAKVSKPVAVSTPVTSSNVQLNEDVAIIESKISQIKDLFPDYGKGFLAACLEAYNRNPEEVIQRILEDTLHGDLKSLDTTMETMPAPKSTLAATRNDKGKGILVESSQPPATNKMTIVGEQRTEVVPSVSSSSSSSLVGRYVRKPRTDLPSSVILDTRDEKDSAKTAAIVSQYEYDDEYDDSFDDLGLSVVESALEDNEMNSMSVKSWGTETENPAQTGVNSKWGSKKKPQYYVRDGKNYSYKVAGSVAVANANEAALMNESHSEQIHGLGRGGNLPTGAVAKLEKYVEQNYQSDVPETAGPVNTGNGGGRGWGRGKTREAHEGQANKQSDGTGMEGRGSMGNARGRGRGRGRGRESPEEQPEAANGSEMEGGRGNMGNLRGGGGGGGRGRRGGGGRNHSRKDQAMKKHFSGLTGF